MLQWVTPNAEAQLEIAVLHKPIIWFKKRKTTGEQIIICIFFLEKKNKQKNI